MSKEPQLEIEVLDYDARALKDFSYEGEEFPAFREGDPLQLRQGGECFFIWDAGHDHFLYTTRDLDWLFEHLAFHFRVVRKPSPEHLMARRKKV